ncbi:MULTISPECIES: SusD/RagB family nutrient-binding outer membrane lipoprotein [Chitinophagaceae]
MTKTLLKYILIGTFVSSIVSCSKQLSDINQNPNAPSNPDPAYLLTGVEKTAADNYWGSAANYSGSQLITQQWARIQYTDLDRYIYNNSTFTSFWNNILVYNIHDLNTIMNIGRSTGNSNYTGVGHVLRAWDFQLLTDAFGDVPYSQTDNVDSFATQKYDYQQDIYHALVKELDSAQLQLDENGTAIGGDRIFNGDIKKWKKLANALKVRIALRVADQESDVAKQWIQEVVASSYQMTSINDNAAFTYSSSPNWNPVANIFSTRQDSRISQTVVQRLSALNDPRLPVYADHPDSLPNAYVGVPNGLLTNDAAAYGLAKTSRPGAYFTKDVAPAVILTFAEYQFFLAEAVARGYISGNAETYYKNAITASLNQYSITDQTIINNYLNQTSVKFDAANYKKSVGEQKWIALFGQGLEAFAEWRRLDYPILTPAAAGVLSGKMPVRFIYPGTEQTLNNANYTAAVDHQGADNTLAHLWFDVK